MIATTRYLFFILSIFFATSAEAQGVSWSDTLKIPGNFTPEFKRQRNHDVIDAEQKAILASDLGLTPGNDGREMP